jgi:homoserine kinase
VLVLAQPELELATRESRGALPREVPLATAVAFGQNVAAFVHALHAGDRALLAATFRDVLAEPHRAPLVRGFAGVQRAALGAGALACSLSGSGPAVFAVAGRDAARIVGEAMERAFAAAGVGCRIRPCTLDSRGARPS